MSNSSSSKAGPFTADGTIPGEGPQPVTDLVSRPDSVGQRSRPTDYIQSPTMAGSIAEGGEIRDPLATQGPAPTDLVASDADTHPDQAPIDGRGPGISDAFAVADRGVGSVGSSAVPFKSLARAERGSR
jgi:hypothetical protein